jgi:hypothetical protein
VNFRTQLENLLSLPELVARLGREVLAGGAVEHDV